MSGGKDVGSQGNTYLDLEALNRYVLAAIGVFAIILYFGCLYAGLIEFRSRTSRNNGNKKRSPNRVTRKLRNPKVSGD